MGIATFGGGCFWCIEAVFKKVKGIQNITSGYAGGTDPHPTYKSVCSGTTGHAEVLQIEFDETIISYEDLLKIFWTVHDPTTPNRQGNDVGTQYRSIVLFHNENQKEVAESVRDSIASQIWDDPVVTEIVPLQAFYPAESYHQDYYTNNPNNRYCQIVIEPKVAKLRKVFMDKLAEV
ncbi:peptide-methionine (S)-S-oxide reductase MsrA [Membranihabitans maritimus]|uniref:peptide-methionine (S)-S-oxide reductase MsrA n=1 Tax=Membranihabitans maritimus TaxID=2904244 RepID=UPI001F02893B|nr:peptide-methionine (S)-S-oxide reductase MsrA [Membranihabitans maritimus]